MIDTYDTIAGARKAAEVAKEMAARGQRLKGVRIDSGDLAGLGIKVRKILDEAGLPDIKIIGSGGLGEYDLTELLRSANSFRQLRRGNQDGHLERCAMVRYGLQTC